MSRIALFTALLIGLLTTGSKADSETIPPPREILADGSRAPAPAPDPNTQTAKAAKPGTELKADDPAQTVEKIIKNSKEIAERLSMTDTGKDTLKTQDETLALIDSLLNPPNPPPSGGSDNKQDMNDQKDKNDDKKDMKDPSGGKDNKQEPKMGMDPQGGMQPQDGNKQANSGRRPRMGSDNDKKEPDMTPMAGNDKKEPMPGGMAKGGMPMMPMPGGNMNPNGGVPMGTLTAKPTLPLDDEVTKEVWGHLPDKLRQQVTQYYKEQFMPKYSDLLKQYYSSLANQNPKMPELKK